MEWKVTYRNEGRPEKGFYDSEGEATKGADFLRFQGATAIRVTRATAQEEAKRAYWAAYWANLEK